ncbi:hypothetical protein [Aquicella lusitana]|nr:hypothetical protein [Aquicella lusitana]
MSFRIDHSVTPRLLLRDDKKQVRDDQKAGVGEESKYWKKPR